MPTTLSTSARLQPINWPNVVMGDPIGVDENTVMLAEHGRAEAPRQEGYSHLPVLRYSHLTDAQRFFGGPGHLLHSALIFSAAHLRVGHRKK